MITTSNQTRLSKINNGTYTLVNTKTNSYITINIKTAQRGNLKGKRIVSKLVGRDNTSDYQGFGFVVGDMIMVWQRQNSQKNAQIASILQSLCVEGDNSRFADKVEMKLSKRCMRCNRKLTTPESIDLGIGPECRAKGLSF